MVNSHMFRLYSLLFLLSFHAYQGAGQDRIIDSLTNALNGSGDNTQRVDILNELAFSFYDHNSEKAFEYASKAYDLANEIKYLKGIRKALSLKGFYFYVTGNYSRALEFYRNATAQDQAGDELLGYNLVLTANAFRALAQYDSAKYFYDRSIKILR